MSLAYSSFRGELQRRNLWPTTWVARAAWYSLALSVLLAIVRGLLSALKLPGGSALGGWISFLSSIAIVLFTVLAFRWLKAKLLWRLRNRLIVTYVFIGVVPALLLIAMVFATLWLFAGQFANFIVTSEIHLHLRSVEAVNAAIAHDLAAQLQRGRPAADELVENLREGEVIWKHRKVCAWQGTHPLPICGHEK